MKITVVGAAGNVGATCANVLASKNIATELVMVDIAEGILKGRSLDMYQAMPIVTSSTKITPATGWPATAGSDIVVISAGIARKPGMTRDDLLKTNSGIVAEVAGQAAKASPKAIFIIVSNPLDVMTYVALKVTGLPRKQVIGMAGILDTARYRTFLSMELNISSKDISALVLGGHGDTMVPLTRYTTVSGVPITDLIPADKLQAIVERTADGGGEIVRYLQTGSAWYAPGTAAAEIAEAVALDQRRLLPCTVLLDGEYGHKDLTIGVPIVVGRGGVEQIMELNLTPAEKAAFDKSAAHVASTIKDALPMINM